MNIFERPSFSQSHRVATHEISVIHKGQLGGNGKDPGVRGNSDSWI